MGQTFTVDVFSGMTPKVADHLLKGSQSASAQNCKLISGELRTWQGDTLVVEKENIGEAQSIIRYDNFWHVFNEEVEWAKAPVVGDEYDRIVLTGLDKPVVTDTTLVSPTVFDYHYLGIPSPTVAPTAALSGGTGGTITDTYWVYTYVRKWADGKVDEGPPSPISNLLELDSNGTADLTTIEDLPNYADYGVTHKYVYRTQTGSTTANFQFVKELPIGTTLTTDDVAGIDLGETLVSQSWGAPPDDMRGIVNVGNGIMAGFVGNTVYMCDTFQAHGWSDTQTFPCEYNVVGLGVYNNILIVLTEGYPISAYISSPTQFQVIPHKELLPCLSHKSIISMKTGVIYASDNGLILIDQQGPRPLTSNFFDDIQWNDLNPSSMLGMFHDNQYFWFWTKQVPYVDDFGQEQFRTEQGSYILNMVDSNAALTTTNIPFGPLFRVIENNTVYYAKDTADTTQIYRWEGSTIRSKSFVWKSKEFVSTTGDINMSAARVLARFIGTTVDEEGEIENEFANLLAEGLFGSYNESSYNTYSINGDRLQEIAKYFLEPKSLYFSLYVDGSKKFIKKVKDDKIFRLPTALKGRRFHIELSGNIDVQQVQIATSAQEIV